MKNLQEEKRPVISLNKVCKRFGGVVAADEITLELFPKEIFGLIGPNGSGKTTLINLITGIYKVDSGTICLSDTDITNAQSYIRARKGILRTFQQPRMLKSCDIKTNIYLGIDLAKKRSIAFNFDLLDRLLDAAGLKIDMNDSIDKLSYGQQKLLEIVRAILAEPKVLLLDEPAAGLNYKEMEKITALIDITIERDTSVLLIEHAMDLVMNICNRLTVLNFGHQIASGIPEEIQDNQAVIEAYLGRDRSA